MKFNYDKTESVKKLDMEKTLENYINNNGIAHIVYVADGINDILDRHSPEGYQAISAEFAEYVKTRLEYVKNDMPLLLEITGCRFGEEE